MSSVSWPSSSSTIASVGSNGAPIPASSDLAGAENPSGNLTPLQVDSAGNLLVSLNADPSAPQSVNLTEVGGSAISEGQKTSANSLPVVIASDQSAITVAQATAASLNATVVQGTAANLKASVNLNDGAGSAVDKGQTNMAGSLPVVIASDQSAVSVSGTVAVTGVATAANQTNATQKTQVVDGSGNVIAATSNALNVSVQGTPAISGTVTANQGTANATPWNDNISQWGGSATTLGSKASASSVPVVIASDQASVAITDATLDLYFTGPTAATQVINTNLLTNPTATTATDFQGYRSISFQVNTGASTTAVAVNFEASDDNVNFIAIGMYDKTTPTAAPITTFTTAASTQRYFEGPLTARYFRVRLVAAITAGTVQAFSIARKEAYMPTQLSLAAGTQIIGALSANQSTNVAQINGVAPLMGNGVTGTGSLRVTLASDTSSNSNPLLTAQKGLAVANAPVQNTYSSTNITTSAYVQLIASTTSATTFVDIFDSSGQAMILGVGSAGSEVIQAYVPPGGDSFFLAIPSGSRVAYKALTATANSGYLLLNLRG